MPRSPFPGQARAELAKLRDSIDDKLRDAVGGGRNKASGKEAARMRGGL